MRNFFLGATDPDGPVSHHYKIFTITFIEKQHTR